jgi:putative DNA primase/helicase
VTALAKDSIVRGFAEVPYQHTPEDQKNLSSHLIRSQNTSKLQAMVENICSEPGVAIPRSQLDADGRLAGVQGGQVLDIPTGQCRPVRREDYITKRLGCRFDKDATCPTWERVLLRAMQGAVGMVRYLQQIVGMMLMGNPLRLAFFLNGPSNTAKSVFIETIKSLLNNYAMAAGRTLLMSKARENRHGPSEELVRLAGSRLVTVSEVQEGDVLDDGMFKTLLGGGDEIAARGLYMSTVEFRPDFVILVRCNHRPIFNGSDDSVLNRIHLVPFMDVIPLAERDRGLMKRLRETELPGVLNWALAGAHDLLAKDLQLEIPEPVRQATAEYGAEMDPIGQFIAQECELVTEASESANALHGFYKLWCKEHSTVVMTSTEFGKKMSLRFEKKHGNDGNRYMGIRYRDRSEM